MTGRGSKLSSLAILGANSLHNMREAEEQKPVLRISHIVYGRETSGKRVYYLVDPQGKGEKKPFPKPWF